MSPMRYAEVRARPDDLAFFAEERGPKVEQPRRIALEPDNIEHGLVQLVLSVIELIRQLLEKQALRRVESGRLTAEQEEKLGVTLQRLEEKMDELKRHFQIDDLNLDLGPLGTTIDE